jgi:hypothetical protein
MRDVFISYARDDRDRAAELARALEARGLSVWWDREIPPGRAFDEVIEEALGSARCVLVLWSEQSVSSRWVRAEASAAAERGVLVPVLVRAIEPPLEFRNIQAADLTEWSGADDHPEWQRLFGTVSAMAKTSADVPVPRRQKSRAIAGYGQRAIIALVSLVAGAGLAYLLLTRPQADDRESPAVTDPPAPTAGAPSVTETSPTNPPVANAATATGAAPASGRIDLLAASNGGHLVRAPHENWMQPIDGSEAWDYISGAEAVYAFKDEKPATFDVFRMLITETRGYNIKSFELLAASDGPNGQFQSLGNFETQNVRLFPSPWQDFTFSPVTARYLKVRVRSLYATSGPTQVEQWQLLGRF